MRPAGYPSQSKHDDGCCRELVCVTDFFRYFAYAACFWLDLVCLAESCVLVHTSPPTERDMF